MEANELIQLIDRYLNGTATELEQEWVENYCDSFQRDFAWDETRHGSRATATAEVIARLQDKLDEELLPAIEPVKPIPLFRRSLVRYAAAILVLAGAGTLFILQPWKEQPSQTAAVIPLNDIQPATRKAYITLGDGSQVVLENVKVGGRVGQATKTADGKLVYTAASEEAVSYNTVTVPRGGEPQHLQLPDHTEVWLNTASSITYPTKFTGDTREISMTGQAYFEVAKTGQRFFAQTRTDKIEVMGTHFDINAYEEEGSVKTTLIEGKIKIGNSILSPDEQYSDGKVITLDAAAMQRVSAWRNGQFSYENVDVKTLMRDLSRWYDVEVVFEGEPTNRRFKGEIGRSLSLKDVLEGLAFKKVNFRLEKTTKGNRIVMLP